MEPIQAQMVFCCAEQWMSGRFYQVEPWGDGLRLDSARAATGVYCMAAVDSGENGFSWGRAAVEADLPPDTALRVYAYASDHRGWGSWSDLDQGIRSLEGDPMPVLREVFGPPVSESGDCLLGKTGRYLWVMLELTAAGAVLLLSLPQVRGEHLLPLWWGDALPVLQSTVPLLGVLGYGVFAAFLLGDTEPSPRRGRDWTLWAGGSCLLLGAEQAVVIGNLGPELARRLNSPFFALAKSVGVEGAFQRVESIIAALWTFVDLSLLGVLAFALWKAAKQVFPRAKQGRAGDRRLSGGGDGGRLRPGDRPAGQFNDGAGAAAFGAGRVLGAGDVPSLPTFCV